MSPPPGHGSLAPMAISGVVTGACHIALNQRAGGRLSWLQGARRRKTSDRRRVNTGREVTAEELWPTCAALGEGKREPMVAANKPAKTLGGCTSTD